jgi:hypothetical protein
MTPILALSSLVSVVAAAGLLAGGAAADAGRDD